MLVGRYTSLILLLLGFAGLLVPGQAAALDADTVLLNPERFAVQTGRFSRFAAFQAKLQEALSRCGERESSVVPVGEAPSGKLDRATSAGIQRLRECRRLGKDPRANGFGGGAITVGVWRSVMGQEPLPTVEERAKALVLSFEATDFGDAPEWNLCQDGTKASHGPSNRRRGAFRCFNESDPCSFLTWGPRGATAGSGREIQYILWLLTERDPALLKRTFGSEYDSMLRFIRLKGGEPGRCSGDIPLKKFVCAIWINSTRRQAWETAFASLGHAEVTRQAYDQIYALREFDGGKFESFYDLWKQLGLTPSEVDYAFFIDRITHLGGPPEAQPSFVGEMSRCIGGETVALSRNAAARRCLGRLQLRSSQATLRMGRDVAYYLDSYPEGSLSAAEIEAWGGYIPLSATFNLGLSDSRPHDRPVVGTLATGSGNLPKADDVRLTPEESTSCPANVLTPEPRR